MAAEQDFLGFVDPSRKVRRPPLVGMEFLHESPVRRADLVDARPRLHPKDLVSFLLGHRVGGSRSLARPRCRVLLEVFTPAGKPAVQISFEE